MASLPHRFHVTLRGGPEGLATVTIAGAPELATAPPAEFDGPGDAWSPEHLLLASVETCFLFTLRVVAQASRVSFTEASVTAEGTVDRQDGGLRFTEIVLRARLVVPAQVTECATDNNTLDAAWVRARATDRAGLFDEQSFSVQVVDQNQAPVITSTPAAATGVGRRFVYAPTVVDPDRGDAMSYTLASAPIGMSINRLTGEITFLRDLTFRIGLCPVPRTWDRLLPLVSSGRLHPEVVITHRMALSEGPKAYEMFDARDTGVLKIVLDPTR